MRGVAPISRPVCHQYDCFDPARPTCNGGTFVFHNECVSNRTGYEGRVCSTRWKTRSAKNGDIGRRVIIKMDIEGAEWESLLAAPDELLASIPQIAMEMHGFDDPKILEALRKLKRNFYLVNLHFNNWSCTPKAAPLPAWAYQVLWVNKRIGVARSGGAGARANEPAERARLADVAGLSVARSRGQCNNRFRAAEGSLAIRCKARLFKLATNLLLAIMESNKTHR